MVFTAKEIVVLVIGTGLAFASFKANDPLVFFPCIGISWASFVYICVSHSGSFIARLIIALMISCAFVLLSFRTYKSVELAPLDPRIIKWGQDTKSLKEAFTKSPSVPDAAKMPLLQDQLDELSKKKDTLTNREKEILQHGKITLKSLEEARQNYLEKQKVEKQQQELTKRQQEIGKRKIREVTDSRDKKFSEPLIKVVDYAINRLYDMLREISSESIFSDFPGDRPSVYNSSFLKDATFVQGQHVLRLGSHKGWEFHCNCGGTDVAGYLSKYFGFSIRAGATEMMIRSDAYGGDGVTTRHLDIFCVHSDDNPHERKQLYSERCSVSEYQESIQKALTELIKDRYNEEPLQSNP